MEKLSKKEWERKARLAFAFLTRRYKEEGLSEKEAMERAAQADVQLVRDTIEIFGSAEHPSDANGIEGVAKAIRGDDGNGLNVIKEHIKRFFTRVLLFKLVVYPIAAVIFFVTLITSSIFVARILAPEYYCAGAYWLSNAQAYKFCDDLKTSNNENEQLKPNHGGSATNKKVDKKAVSEMGSSNPLTAK